MEERTRSPRDKDKDEKTDKSAKSWDTKQYEYYGDKSWDTKQYYGDKSCDQQYTTQADDSSTMAQVMGPAVHDDKGKGTASNAKAKAALGKGKDDDKGKGMAAKARAKAALGKGNDMSIGLPAPDTPFVFQEDLTPEYMLAQEWDVIPDQGDTDALEHAIRMTRISND